MNRITETLLAIHEWLAALSPQFAFLLAMPFVVAAAGLAADALARMRAAAAAAPLAVAKFTGIVALVVVAAIATPAAHAGSDDAGLRALVKSYTDGLDASRAGEAQYVPVRHRVQDLHIAAGPAGTAILRGHLQAWRVRKGGSEVTPLGDLEMRARKAQDGWHIEDVRLQRHLIVRKDL